MEDYTKKAVGDLASRLITNSMNNGTVTIKNDRLRVLYPRFSSFPFCGVKWFFGLPSLLSASAVKDFAFGYFTSVGHAVHNVQQESITRYLRELGNDDIKVYWDYECQNPECKKRHYLKSEPPKECSECGGNNLKREEHEVKYKGALGHVDLIVSFKLNPKLREEIGEKEISLVMDYKTTSIYNTTEKVHTLPYVGNQAQIDKYTGVLQLRTKHLPPVVGNALVYLPRDVPFRHKTFFKYISPEEGKKHRNDIVKYVADHTRWATLESLEEALEYFDERPCQSPDDVPREYCDCEFNKICTGSQGAKHLKDIYGRVKKHIPIRKE